MLENAPVSLLLDVLEVLASLALGGIVLAHVTQPAGEFGQSLAVGALADPGDREMLGSNERRPSQQADDGLVVKAGGAHAVRRIWGKAEIKEIGRAHV